MSEEIQNQEEDNCGYATVGYGSGDEREIPMDKLLQTNFKDGRKISIAELKNNEGYIISVENHKSSGRNLQNSVWLSPESLFGMISSIMMFTTMAGINLEEGLKLATEKDEIDYKFGGNLKPFELPKQ